MKGGGGKESGRVDSRSPQALIFSLKVLKWPLCIYAAARRDRTWDATVDSRRTRRSRLTSLRVRPAASEPLGGVVPKLPPWAEGGAPGRARPRTGPRPRREPAHRAHRSRAAGTRPGASSRREELAELFWALAGANLSSVPLPPGSPSLRPLRRPRGWGQLRHSESNGPSHSGTGVTPFWAGKSRGEGGLPDAAP